MISRNELQILLIKLVENTKSAKIEWALLADNTYRCSFPRSSVTVCHRRQDASYALLVQNDEGEEVGRLAARGLESNLPGSTYSPLKELYDLAERKALSIDETLKDLWNNLA